MSMEMLAALHAECFPDKPWTAGDFSELRNSGCEMIASENSFIVWRVAWDEAEIVSIGVRPSARAGGIAGALITVMENDLRKKGVKRIFLEVAVDNGAAIGLYEKNGFVRVGARPKYYDGIDGIIMEKKI